MNEKSTEKSKLMNCERQPTNDRNWARTHFLPQSFKTLDSDFPVLRIASVVDIDSQRTRLIGIHSEPVTLIRFCPTRNEPLAIGTTNVSDSHY
ncbi:unnamed protein product [Lactuca virosa]|uniref:Uncharacterized protein n=1 Tax=Lactuca virosa TaxID=75947 RepID=A0AAU9PT30_9ASTR|nr:unnamed protein product [Lactuca virosa]